MPGFISQHFFPRGRPTNFGCTTLTSPFVSSMVTWYWYTSWFPSQSVSSHTETSSSSRSLNEKHCNAESGRDTEMRTSDWP